MNRVAGRMSGVAACWVLVVSAVQAQPHTAGVPALSSRPGAAYTIYLDPAGYNFSGTWGTSLPGNNLGLNNRGPNETFNANDVTQIQAIYGAMANQFRSFNVNITTVDPAIAAGQATSDDTRKSYYDSQVGMMHTVIGPPGNAGWQGNADGLAFGNTIGTVQSFGQRQPHELDVQPGRQFRQPRRRRQLHR